MRTFSRLVVLALALGGCSEPSSATLGPPETLLRCGEFDLVNPAEPVVTGEDEVGCRVFAPVPCVQRIDLYASLCGSQCWPDTGINADGEEWLLGCQTTSPSACLGAKASTGLCVLDPYVGAQYWYSGPDCVAPFRDIYCWERCDGTGLVYPEGCGRSARQSRPVPPAQPALIR